jgi:hypothetical protein
MFNRENITSLEQELGLKYPPSFKREANELVSLSKEKGFQKVFPGVRFIISASEIRKIHTDGVPPSIIPFMTAENLPDYYSFDISSPGPEFKVAVFADHAVVFDWANFGAFLEWIHGKLQTQKK